MSQSKGFSVRCRCGHDKSSTTSFQDIFDSPRVVAANKNRELLIEETSVAGSASYRYDWYEAAKEKPLPVVHLRHSREIDRRWAVMADRCCGR